VEFDLFLEVSQCLIELLLARDQLRRMDHDGRRAAENYFGKIELSSDLRVLFEQCHLVPSC
jgi:hypothetical protein